MRLFQTTARRKARAKAERIAEQQRRKRDLWDAAKEELGVETDQELSTLMQAQVGMHRGQPIRPAATSPTTPTADMSQLQTRAQTAFDTMHALSLGEAAMLQVMNGEEQREFDQARRTFEDAREALRKVGVPLKLRTYQPEPRESTTADVVDPVQHPGKPATRVAYRTAPAGTMHKNFIRPSISFAKFYELREAWTAAGKPTNGPELRAMREACGLH